MSGQWWRRFSIRLNPFAVPMSAKKPDVPDSISGIGTTNQTYIHFSPVLLTPANVATILHQVERAVPTFFIPALHVIATSACQAFLRYDAKVCEARTEHQSQNDRWEELVAKPVAAELTAAKHEKDLLERAAIGCRIVAIRAAAALGLNFSLSDVMSVDACQEMIERNSHSDERQIGTSDSASLNAPVPAWLDSLASLSPIFLTILTAVGLMKLLSGQDLNTAIGSPMFAVAVALALGTCVPTLIGAYRFGWILATLNEDHARAIHSLRSRAGLILGAFAVGLPALFLAAIDGLAVKVLAAQMAPEGSRPEELLNLGAFLPVIGFAFMGAATIAKVWTGYCDSMVDFQQRNVMCRDEASARALRQSSTTVIVNVAQADVVLARVAELAEIVDDASARLAELEFTPDFSKELLDETAVERDAWVGESGRFWGLVWDAIPHTMAPTLNEKRTYVRKESFWSWLKRKVGR